MMNNDYQTFKNERHVGTAFSSRIVSHKYKIKKHLIGLGKRSGVFQVRPVRLSGLT